MIQKNVVLKLPFSVLTYRIIQAVIFSVVLAILTKFFPQTSDYYILISVVWLVLSVGYTIAYLATFSYVIGDDAVTVNSGVFFKSNKITNYNNLQNIETKTGPVLMMFGLSHLRGFTSSPAQLVITSSGNGRTNTSVKPDVQITLNKE